MSTLTPSTQRRHNTLQHSTADGTTRRTFALYSVATITGLAGVDPAMAQGRDAPLFDFRQIAKVFDALKVQVKHAAHAGIMLKAPEVAENGASVPIELEVNIPNLKRIVILGEKNTFPVLMDTEWLAAGPAYLQANIKLGETSHVRVVAYTDKEVFSTSSSVQVVSGGCVGG